MAVSHGCALLAIWADVADSSPNATTASSVTSEGEPIWVSFRGADPPALSTLAVHIPDRRAPDDIHMVPKVLSADAGLFVLRVPHHLWGSLGARFSDYFVYTITHATRPALLHRLPELQLDDVLFRDKEVAVLSCGGGGGYVVAALMNRPGWGQKFSLHLCRSAGGKAPECWTSQVMSVEEPLRDAVYPVPDSARSQEYHVTTKVIVIGGDGGTIGWVDLWRGIILCDVLSVKPELRDMPLPKPTRGSRISFRNSDPYLFRDITVNKLRNTIKYVHMTIRPREVPVTPSFSYAEEPEYMVVPGSWKATTYTMPIPVTSWDDWRRGCFIRSDDLDLPVDKPEHCDLLRELMISGVDSKGQEATTEEEEATCLSLESLQMAHPALHW